MSTKALVSFKAKDKVYLLIGENNVVQAFKSVQKASDYFESSYMKCHNRGYESSMSACLNYITFNPAIHPWEHEDLSKLVDMGVINPETFSSYTIRNISGQITGALCTGENASSWHDSGITPNLIKEEG